MSTRSTAVVNLDMPTFIPYVHHEDIGSYTYLCSA